MSEYLEEARHQDESATIAAEESLDSLQVTLLNSYSNDEAPSAEATDGVAEVVPEHGRAPRDERNGLDVERALRGEEGTGDEERLAGRGNSEALDRDAAKERRIPVSGHEELRECRELLKQRGLLRSVLTAGGRRWNRRPGAFAGGRLTRKAKLEPLECERLNRY